MHPSCRLIVRLVCAAIGARVGRKRTARIGCATNRHGPTFSVKCHDIVYSGCQDILYTFSLAGVFIPLAENAEGARRATGAFSALDRATTSARDPRRSRSISRTYMCR